MKTWGLGLFAALALSGSAFADDQEDVGAWVSPKIEMMRAGWPKDAQGRQVYGKVTLSCGFGSKGFATDCTVKSSEPADPALEAAALKLAPLFSKVRNRSTARSILDIDMRYDEPPSWLKKPTLDDMFMVWPRKAASMGLSGWGAVKCVVNLQGLLQACSVIGESPPGRGFGEAAKALTPIFLMTPATRSGQPVESEITIPVTFATEDGVFLQLPNAQIIGMPAWSKAPSAAEVLTEIDRKVGDKFADGKIVFLCSFNKTTGKMTNCEIANASPGMAQFRDVANALVLKFEADPKTLAQLKSSLGATQTDAKVILPFAFPDMASPGWGKRYITHVQWAHPYDPPPPGQPTLPDEAVKAGLKDGSATVDCQIAEDGVLSQCAVLSESTPGVGLGALARRIAEGWVANRWTEEGLPVADARVRLPIKMVYGKRPYVESDPALAAKP
jgi:TonB family protein